MVRVRHTDGPSRAPAAQAVAPQTAMETTTAGAPKLLDRLREALRSRHSYFRNYGHRKTRCNGVSCGQETESPHHMRINLIVVPQQQRRWYEDRGA